MVHSMRVGSVTVDLAAATGGNIATTKQDEVRAGITLASLQSVR